MVPAEALQDFHRTLLPATLENAARTAFYRRRWQGLDVLALTVDDLAELPLVYKEEIRQAGRTAQVCDGLVCNEVFTGGTTGPSMVTVKGDREQRFIYQFFRETLCNDDRPDFRALQINNPYHGHLVNIPAPMFSHKIGIYDAGSFDHGRRILLEEHEDRDVASRCTVLVGLERCLRAFTLETLRLYPDGFPCHLKQVITYSQLLTQRWKERLESTWGCTVVDRFCLSEIFGGATLDTDLGWWRFDPVLIPEVVGAKSLRPIHDGLGILVLTGLAPFQEAQPMVRYFTGDLVEARHDPPCEDGTPGILWIRPLGRARYGVPNVEGDGWLLTPKDVFELLDETPEVARAPRFLDSRQVSDPYAVGHARYRLGHRIDGDRVMIDLDCVLTPEAAAREKAVVRRVNESLSALPSLAPAHKGGLAELRVRAVDDLPVDLISHADSGSPPEAALSIFATKGLAGLPIRMAGSRGHLALPTRAPAQAMDPRLGRRRFLRMRAGAVYRPSPVGRSAHPDGPGA